MSRGFITLQAFKRTAGCSAYQTGRTDADTWLPGTCLQLKCNLSLFFVMFSKEVGKHPARLKYAWVIWISCR